MVIGVLWTEIIGVIGLRFRERCFDVWMIDFEKDGCQSGFLVAGVRVVDMKRIEGLTGCCEYCAWFDACLLAGLVVFWCCSRL